MKKLKKQKKYEEFAFDVSCWVQEARVYAGMTQKKLAKKIGTKQPSIARAERGSTLPSLSMLYRISVATDFPLPKF